MSVAIVVAALVVVVIGAIVWARVGSARSATKSVDTYEHALDVLGEVSKRTTEPTGFRILPHEETGRPHVRTAGHAVDDDHTETGAPPPTVGRPRIVPPAPAGLPKFSVEPASARLRAPTDDSTVPVPAFVDDSMPPEEAEAAAAAEAEALAMAAAGGDEVGSGAEAAAEGAPAGASLAEGAPAGASAAGPEQAPAPRRHSARRQDPDEVARQQRVRRVSTAVAGAVALVAIVGVVLISTGGGGGKAGTTTTTTSHHGSTTTSSSTTTTQPPALQPTTDSAGNVAYAVPVGDFTVAFQATGGSSWIGIQQAASGPYLADSTVADGQVYDYKATGPIIVTMGAPGVIAMKMNGITVQPPAGGTFPSVVVFTPASPPSTTTTTLAPTTTTLAPTTTTLAPATTTTTLPQTAG